MYTDGQRYKDILSVGITKVNVAEVMDRYNDNSMQHGLYKMMHVQDYNGTSRIIVLCGMWNKSLGILFQ